MKKIVCSLLFVVLSCVVVLPALAAAQSEEKGTQDEPKFEEVCQTGNIEFIYDFGYGDKAGVKYRNVFTRFISGQDDSPDFWFYVYQRSEIYLYDGANKAYFESFPQYIAARVYANNPEEKVYEKFDIYTTGFFVMNNSGRFNPFYFKYNGQEHAILPHLRPDLVILSGPIDGNILARFNTDTFRQVSCGAEKPEFTDMLNTFTL